LKELSLDVAYTRVVLRTFRAAAESEGEGAIAESEIGERVVVDELGDMDGGEIGYGDGN
jgi:hypothetical protein